MSGIGQPILFCQRKIASLTLLKFGRNILGDCHLRSVHTTPEEFEIWPTVHTLIRHENGAFRKTLFKPGEIWKHRLCFADRKHFENRAFWKRWHYDNASFLRRSVDSKHLMRFQSETSVFKFLLRSVDKALNNVLKKVNCHCHGEKDGCKGRLKATSISDILCFSGQGSFTFIREKSGNFENRCLCWPCYKEHTNVDYFLRL